MTRRDLLERLQEEEIQQGFEPLWPVSDLDGNVSVEEMLACEGEMTFRSRLHSSSSKLDKTLKC